MTAHDVAATYTPPHAARVQRLRAYVDGTQYDGRVPYLAQSADAPPVLERAPCIVDPIVRRAIDSHVDMLIGEGRWPRFGSVDMVETDRRGRVRRASRTLIGDGLATGCGAVLGQIDGSGKIAWSSVPMEWTTTVTVGETIVGASTVYPYVDVECIDGRWCERAYLYRRDVTPAAIVDYAPALCREDGGPVVWRGVSEAAHGFERVPMVVWRYSRAIHAELLDEIDALNFALSQRHRAALYAGDPQIWERGTSGEEAQPKGRVADTYAELRADGKGPLPRGTYRTEGTTRGGAKRKGPGVIWSHESTEYEAHMMTLPGDALSAIDANARDIAERVSRALRFVEMDPEASGAAAMASGKALAIRYQRQVSYIDGLREDVGEHAVLPVVALAREGLGLDPISDDDPIVWGEYFSDSAASRAQTYLTSAQAISALADAGIDVDPVIASLGLSRKPGVKEAAEIYQYHIEQGIVTKNEVRERLGLPPMPEDGPDGPATLPPSPIPTE